MRPVFGICGLMLVIDRGNNHNWMFWVGVVYVLLAIFLVPSTTSHEGRLGFCFSVLTPSGPVFFRSEDEDQAGELAERFGVDVIKLVEAT